MKKVISLDVYDERGQKLGKKRFYTQTLDKQKSLNQWWVRHKDSANESLGLMSSYPCDFQNQQKVCILSRPLARYCLDFTKYNLVPFSVYFAVRHCIPHTWINHNDQFLAPKKKWLSDTEFQNDCLAFTLFHTKNRITAQRDLGGGVNHFIPFGETEVGAKEAFASNFMARFLSGRVKPDSPKPSTNAKSLFSDEISFIPTKPLVFSAESRTLFDAGRRLWAHYHTKAQDCKNYLNDAALYDIKAHFQGFELKEGKKGKMRHPSKAEDSAYKELLGDLNTALSALGKKLESKVYEYGFLLE